MKVKIQAGAELDLLNKTEMQDVLNGAMAAWRNEISRSVKFRKFSAQGVVATGAFTIGDAASNNDAANLGPQPGFVWAVTRVAISGDGIVLGTDAYSVYVNTITPSTLVDSGITRTRIFDVPTLVLYGGEQLVLQGAATGAGTNVIVSGQAAELPVQLAWQLL